MTSRKSCSALAAIDIYSLPRWLISITDIPEPFQSSISACARSITAVGSMAGPALKLNNLVMVFVILSQIFDARKIASF